MPEDDRLVARCRDDHLRVVDRNGDGRDHVGVSPHGSAENESFCHGFGFARRLSGYLGFREAKARSESERERKNENKRSIYS